MNEKFADLTTLFYANALRESLPFTSENIPYRHKLKNITKNFLELYNKDVTSQLVGMYNVDGNDENFEAVSGHFEALAKTVVKVPIDELPIVVGLIEAYLEGGIRMEASE